MAKLELTQAPAGFLLLTLPDCRLVSSNNQLPEINGVLAVVCVTLDVQSPNSSSPPGLSQAGDVARDVWLVLRIGESFELPISPTQTILHSRSTRTYTLTPNSAESASITITVPSAISDIMEEDLETLEVLLSQYAILQEVDPDPPGSDGDLKGRLVLVNPDDGEFIGSLGNEVQIDEDPNVQRSGKVPVVADITEDGRNVHIRAVDPEEYDFIVKSAEFLGQGIVYTANLLASGISYASSVYIANSKPASAPLVFSDTTLATFRRLHSISGQAVDITSKTTGLIHDVIDRVASKVGGTSINKTGTRESGGTTPTRTEKPRLLNRLLLSTDMLLSAVEQSASTLINTGTQSISAGVAHKFGQDAGHASTLAGKTVHNASLVYFDARGVGRRALLRRMGKGAIRARLGVGKDAKDVVFGSDGAARNSKTPSPKLPPRRLLTPEDYGKQRPSNSKTPPPSLPPRN